MQSLGLNNNKRKEAMDSYFAKTANINVIQPPITFEPSEDSLNRGSSAVYPLPFISLSEQVFLMSGIHFDNRLCSILLLDKLSELLATIPSIGNDILWAKPYVSVSCIAEDTAGNTTIVNRSVGNIRGYGKFIVRVCQKVKLVTVVELLFTGGVQLSTPTSVTVTGFLAPLDHAFRSVLSIATLLPKSGSSL
jgi:hypothetical protein